MTGETALLVFQTATFGALSVVFLYLWATTVHRPYVLLLACARGFVLPSAILHYLAVTREGWGFAELLASVFGTISTIIGFAAIADIVGRRVRVLPIAIAGGLLIIWRFVREEWTADFVLQSLPQVIFRSFCYAWMARHFYRRAEWRGALPLAIILACATALEMSFPFIGRDPVIGPLGVGLASFNAICISHFIVVFLLDQERRAKEAERAKTRTILENLPIRVEVIDESGRTVHRGGSPGTPFGTAESDEPFVLADGDGLPIPDADRPDRRIQKSDMPIAAAEYKLLLADGSRRSVAVAAAPIRDDDDRRVGSLVIYTDIEDLKTARLQIERAERVRMIGALAAGVAHDINNTLAVIIGQTSLLENHPSFAREIGVIAKAAADGAAIVKRLHELGRDPVAKPFTVLPLSAIVNDVVAMCRSRIISSRAAGIVHTMKADVPADLRVVGHAAEVRESLLNLAFNAFDAMPSGGRLTMTARASDAEAVIDIADTGTGIAKDVLPHIFEPFFTTKGSGGSGLGLSMVARAIRAMGGSIEVTRSSAEGTTMTLRLRLAAPGAPTESGTAQPLSARR